ncbi:MAG: SusC/RagA family TonB-linked outer membrane protein [Parabacteroides sp.]|nr:SusC/RagA family TonB-linked outer membrane protein [Parabacteroides sp.]
MLKKINHASLLLLTGTMAFSLNAYADLAPEKPMMTISQQTGKVKGVVEDDFGPVAGASVVVKGTTNGTITDMDGNFTLDGIKNGDIIQISFIGYSTQELKYTGEPSLKIKLVEDSQKLDEVVVTAMGIKKDAKKLGYAVSTIDAGDLVKTGTPDFATSLYGKASGVRIQAAPGGGTSAVSISVRGLSSISGTTQPLIVMDGVPIHNGDANKDDYWTNQRVESNGLVDINPEDIANISILKGAAASALYGSEAANGVVMITTKTGKGTSGLGIDFSANVSFDKVAYMPSIQDQFGPGYDNALRYSYGNEYEQQTGFQNTRTDRNGNSVISPRNTYYSWGMPYDNTTQLYTFNGQTRTYSPVGHNQWNDIFQTGVNQTYNLAVTSGSEKGNMRFSYTYMDNTPTQLNSHNNKHNFSVSGNTNITKTLKLDYSANYMRQQIKNRTYRISRLLTNYSGMFTSFDDVAYLRDHTVTSMGYQNTNYTSDTLTPDEAYDWNPSFNALGSEYFWNLYGKEQRENNNRLIASVTPSWEIIHGLTARGRLSTDLTFDEVENKNSTETPNVFKTPGNYTGSYGTSNSKYEIYYGDIMLMFDRTFAEKYNVTANVGWSGRQERYLKTSVETRGGLSVENWFHLNASALSPGNPSMDKSTLLKTAFFATASVGYDNWAYLEGTVRQEKISTLAPGMNSFFYPSVNGSVIYTSLLKDNNPSWYDYGKVRVSYGIVGNAPMIYKAATGYKQGTADSYIYNQILTSGLGNDNIKPEKKYEFELGWENKFLGNRLGFEMSYYHNRIKDQILNASSSASSGASSIWMNVGELKNVGVEMSMYGTPIQTKDWNWELRANWAWNRNEVVKLADGINSIDHSNVDNGAAILQSYVGESMGDWYVYGTVKDENGNKVVDDKGMYKVDYTKRVKAGNAMPKVVGGFGTSLSYKDFYLDATFDFRFGGDVLNLPYQYMSELGILEASLGGRDAANGGLSWYADGNDLSDPSKRHLTTQAAGSTVNGNFVYDNGVIQSGVKEDGTSNDIIATAGETWYNQYGWGYSGNITYENAVQKNSYIKLRELSLGYNLPKNLVSKFGCKNLMVSVYGRNLFYIYKTLKEFDAECTDGTTWITQAQIGGSTATTRSFGFSVRASF